MAIKVGIIHVWQCICQTAHITLKPEGKTVRMISGIQKKHMKKSRKHLIRLLSIFFIEIYFDPCPTKYTD